uniref:Uncharacterized protein n=1 Tax=Bactrocera latifrons TaxID=174628 RepID=A0A0K8U2W1_BACLA
MSLWPTVLAVTNDDEALVEFGFWSSIEDFIFQLNTLFSSTCSLCNFSMIEEYARRIFEQTLCRPGFQAFHTHALLPLFFVCICASLPSSTLGMCPTPLELWAIATSRGKLSALSPLRHDSPHRTSLRPFHKPMVSLEAAEVQMSALRV